MGELTISLFQRTGLLLVVAFMLTRMPVFRYLLDRRLSVRKIFSYAAVFGAFGIVGTQIGILIMGATVVPHGVLFTLSSNEILIGPALVAIVIAGLLGGPTVGLLSGAIVGLYVFFLGGDAMLADVLVSPLSGLFSGWTARFFSQERVIAPQKAMFIGMFATIVHMGLLLIFTNEPRQMVTVVNMIGLPLVITNSLAIAIFTSMIRVALTEQEQATAIETQRALRIAEEVLPHLRRGMNYEPAREIVTLLHRELKTAAVAMTDSRQVLAFIGSGSDHHKHDQNLQMRLSRVALETGEVQVATSVEQIQCSHDRCPLRAAIVVPLKQSGEAVGLINLYFHRAQQIRTVEIVLAQGLGKLISNQMEMLAAQKAAELAREATLRNLQAQIQPHFLFNTLQMISTLVRVNPDLARHMIGQLSQFMRHNLRTTNSSLITLKQELEHLQAYIEIIKVRFSDRFQIFCHVGDGTQSALIPPSTIQPLVENSIKHGLAQMAGGGKIGVSITNEEERVKIEIKDNGSGFSPVSLSHLGKQAVLSEDGGGIGLYNVNQRLIGLFGEQAALHFENLPAGGCFVSFYIPDASSNRHSGGYC